MQVDQLLNKTKSLLFFRRTPRSREAISCIARKPAREIRTCGWLVRSSHCDFVAVIKLRNSSSCKYKSVCQLEPGNRCLFLTHKTAIVMSPKKCHEDVGIRIEKVFRQSLRDFVKSFSFSKRMPDRIKKGEVQ